MKVVSHSYYLAASNSLYGDRSLFDELKSKYPFPPKTDEPPKIPAYDGVSRVEYEDGTVQVILIHGCNGKGKQDVFGKTSGGETAKDPVTFL